MSDGEIGPRAEHQGYWTMVSATPKCRYQRPPDREVERNVRRRIRSVVRFEDRRSRQCRRSGKRTSWTLQSSRDRRDPYHRPIDSAPAISSNGTGRPTRAFVMTHREAAAKPTPRTIDAG